MFKNILTGAGPHQERPSKALSYALGFGEVFGAHVDILIEAIELDLVLADYAAPVPAFVGSLNDELRQRAEAAAGLARQAAQLTAITCDVSIAQDSLDAVTETLRRAAKLHDITVLDHPGIDNPAMRGMIEACLFGSGHPVLVVPGAWEQAFSADRICVAWDGSAAAARALADAMPFIERAGSVELICVGEPDELLEKIPGAEVAPHIERHGVRVTVTDLPGKSGNAGAIFSEHAAMGRADLLVMGAYAHSRFRESVLGGATRSLLEQARLPVLVSH